MIVDHPDLLLTLDQGNTFDGILPKMNNSKIIFKGSNNVLICEKDVVLSDSLIEFNANNSIIYLSTNPKHEYKLAAGVYNNSTLFIGEDNYFNGKMNIILSEECNCVIGSHCLFSLGIWIRTADPHLIYEIDTKNRINPSKSVYIGDHVWIGQNTMLLKGTEISSGSIVGAISLVSNKKIFNNESWGGNPARLIKKRIFWDGTCVHRWKKVETKKGLNYNDLVDGQRDSNEYIYFFEKEKSIRFQKIDYKLSSLEFNEKMSYIKELARNTDKNRFVDCNKKYKKVC